MRWQPRWIAVKQPPEPWATRTSVGRFGGSSQAGRYSNRLDEIGAAIRERRPSEDGPRRRR